MKTIPINRAPFTAALYLKKCEERRNRKVCEWRDLREAIYRGSLLAFTGLALLFCAVAFVQITVILSK